jgi:hypothetical protein
MGLKFAAGLTNREIASVLGLSEANVAQILHRSVAALRTPVCRGGEHMMTGITTTNVSARTSIVCCAAIPLTIRTTPTTARSHYCRSAGAGAAALRQARPGFESQLEARLITQLPEVNRPWWQRVFGLGSGKAPLTRRLQTVAAALLVTGDSGRRRPGGFALLQQLVESRRVYIEEHNLAQNVHLSQTANGVTVTVERAYADANRLIVTTRSNPTTTELGIPMPADVGSQVNPS